MSGTYARPIEPALDAAIVTARLRELSRMARLDPSGRLDCKVDMSAAAVTRRLRRASDLRAFCVRLRARQLARGFGGSGPGGT